MNQCQISFGMARHQARRPAFPFGIPAVLLVAASLVCAFTSSVAAAEASSADSQRAAGGTRDFTQMSLEELAAVKVTTVSKKAEKLSGVPAAVTVITQDEIRRSGATTIPEALRLAPGVQVARVDSAHWAVSVRGFNDTFAQKLLVMIDGRSVYTPFFSGTLWHVQDVLLEDLDRIEVVRGPGGSVWGANAVNGVINIVTKSAKETQGLLLTAGGGSDHRVLSGVRYGEQIGENAFLRVYGKYDDWDNFKLTTGGDANDAWWKAQGGFRMDWEPSTENRFTLQGDVVGATWNQTVPQVSLSPPYNSALASEFDYTSGNLLGRWTHQFSEDSDLAVQSYFETSHLDSKLVEKDRQTYDLDLRHRFPLGERHEIVWGGGYRLNHSEILGSPEIAFNESSHTDDILNLFVQDELTLVPERLRLTLGNKFEHNNHTGLEYQPSARLAWTPDARQTVWTSVSRAVRTPSQIENHGRINAAVIPPNPPTAPFPTLVSVLGNPGFDAEDLIASELGYRIQLHPRLTLDLAGFVNYYDSLSSPNWQLDASQLPAYMQMVSVLDNESHGKTYGAELSATWQATDWWRLQALFSYIDADLHRPINGVTGQPNVSTFATPRHQASLRPSMDLSRNVEFDVWVRYVAEVENAGAPLPTAPPGSGNIPAYVTFDLRLAWRPCKNVELSIVGQNLADPHPEFVPTFVSTQYTEVGRSVYARFTLEF